MSFRIGGTTYTSQDQALAAFKELTERDLTQVTPMSQKIGGKLLVVLPTVSAIPRYTSLGADKNERLINWLQQTTAVNFDINAVAVSKSQLFDTVEILHVSDPEAQPIGDHNYKLWVSFESNTKPHWQFADRGGLSAELVFGQGYKGSLRLNAFKISVVNAAAQIGIPVVKMPLPESNSAQLATATGFFVDAVGHMITNYHAVNGCKSMKIALPDGEVEANVVATDQNNDLALLKAASPSPAFASFRSYPPVRQGEDVVVYGYPYAGTFLSTKGNLTTGTISALAGLKDDTRILQISAPVQPGNSGGPLLDDMGEVVGVIVAKMNALGVAKVTGDVPQNVNFAIKGGFASEFLASNGVSARLGTPKTKLSTADIGDAAKVFTFMVKCQK